MPKKLVITITILVACVLVYSFTVIYQAGSYTDEVVDNDLNNRIWRIYQGDEKILEARIEYIAQYKVDWRLAVQDPDFYNHRRNWGKRIIS